MHTGHIRYIDTLLKCTTSKPQYNFTEEWKYSAVYLPLHNLNHSVRTTLSTAKLIYTHKSALQYMLYVYQFQHNTNVHMLFNHTGRDKGQIFSMRDTIQPDIILLPYARKCIELLALLDQNKLYDTIHSNQLRILILGLGGGIISDFYSIHFPSAHIDVVEYDEDIIYVADQYFNCITNTNNVKLHVDDAYTYIDQLYNNTYSHYLYDIIIQDFVFTPDNDTTTPIFSHSIYNKLYQLLKHDNSLLAHNLITYDKNVINYEKQKALSVFDRFHTLPVHNGQSIICCIKSDLSTTLSDAIHTIPSVHRLNNKQIKMNWQQLVQQYQLPDWCSIVSPMQQDAVHGVVTKTIN